MTPLVSALVAVAWLASVSAYFWWQRLLQVEHARKAVPVARTALGRRA